MEKPKQKERVDVTKLRRICNLYLDEVDNDDEYTEDCHSNFEACISEIALELLYGEGVFDWINERHE